VQTLLLLLQGCDTLLVHERQQLTIKTIVHQIPPAKVSPSGADLGVRGYPATRPGATGKQPACDMFDLVCCSAPILRRRHERWSRCSTPMKASTCLRLGALYILGYLGTAR
jgi:hypothetical protein